MSKSVIAAGHICVDMNPVLSGNPVAHVEDILSPGKLLHVGQAEIHTGGSVANTGLAMKLLGVDVKLMGKVGKDAFGELIWQILKRYQAEEGLLISNEEDTSYTIVLSIPGIDRIFLHNPGANNHFTASDIPDEDLKQASLLHFGYPPLMASMYENEGSELLLLFQRAKAAGAATSLDMAAVDENSPAGCVNWNAILQKVLPYTDFFLPSVEELLFMLGRDTYQVLKEKAHGEDLTTVIDFESHVLPLAKKCLSYGAKVVLVKCGVPGMLLCTAGAETLSSLSPRLSLNARDWADLTLIEKSYVPEKVLSGTGAGDTSIAAFLCAVLDGETPENALHLATATGACCVEAYDALSGLKPLPELKEKIAAGWKKLS